MFAGSPNHSPLGLETWTEGLRTSFVHNPEAGRPDQDVMPRSGPCAAMQARPRAALFLRPVLHKMGW